MTPDSLPEDMPQFDEDVEASAAEDWDEETLGLDWDEADAQSLVREVIPGRGWDD